MKTYDLKNFTRGWFSGDFEGAIFKTNQFEMCIKRLPAGFYERKHFHKLSSEATIIISGIVEMNGVRYQTDDIIVMEPNEITDFNCITDVISCAVRNASYPSDKYEIEK